MLIFELLSAEIEKAFRSDGKNEKERERKREKERKFRGKVFFSQKMSAEDQRRIIALDLLQKRDNIEEQIDQIKHLLLSPGGYGLEGGLIDREGFPIADVGKIIEVRKHRNQLASKHSPSFPPAKSASHRTVWLIKHSVK